MRKEYSRIFRRKSEYEGLTKSTSIDI